MGVQVRDIHARQGGQGCGSKGTEALASWANAQHLPTSVRLPRYPMQDLRRMGLSCSCSFLALASPCVTHRNDHHRCSPPPETSVWMGGPLPPTPCPQRHSQQPIPLCLVSRRCTIRTATGMTRASAVPSAFTPWPTRPLWPRTTRSCATSAPPGRTHPSARGASSQSWQVVPPSPPGQPGRRPPRAEMMLGARGGGVMLLRAVLRF